MTTATEQKRGPGRPRKVEQAEDAPIPGVTPEPAPTPAQLIQSLHDSGTPIKVVRHLRGWLDEHPDATPTALYDHMAAEEKAGTLNVGTLRKAGKLIHGSRFEPECLVKLAPGEELERLREENDRQRDQIAEQSARILGLTNANTLLQERINEATKTISVLRAGRSTEELQAAGLNVHAADL